jgi:DNA-binding Lrp family transcriptional regulator
LSTPTASAVRVAGRLTVAFLLDFVEIGRGDRALIDAVVMLAMVQANVAPVAREPELQRTYAAYADAVPDEMRRPTSISSLANSLRLPYETVRRRVADMQRRGLCVVTPAGAYVPQEVLSHPEHMVAVFRTYDLMRTFYYRLHDLGLIRLPTPPDVTPLDPVEQVRAIMRLLGDYVLRTVDAITVYGRDLVTGMILLGIFRANTGHRLDPDEGADNGLLSDEERRPISVAALALQLRLPAETVRRHVTQMLQDGMCIRVRRGLIIPLASLTGPNPLRLVDENFGDLMRLFTSLAQLGVLAAWDAARPAELPASVAR